MNLKAWLKSHPVAAFVIVTMAWSWSIWSLLFLFIRPGGLLHNPPPIAFLFVFLGGLGPSLSGLLLTRLIEGRGGMRALGRRLNPRGVGRWWFALLIIPAVTAITPLLRQMAGHAVDGGALLALIGPGLALGIVAGLMEEFGWRGYLLPRLLQRHRPLRATLLLGLIWGGVWHGYADYFGLGDKGLAFWPLVLLLGPGVLTAWSLILTRVYERTGGNLLLAILMHGTISSSALIFGLRYSTLEEELLWTTISVAIAWAGAAVVWLALRPTTRLAVAEGAG